MKEFEYKESGYKLVDEAKTDIETAHQLLAAGYEIIWRLSQKYRDPETTSDIQDIVVILGKRGESQPNWMGINEAKALAKSLVVVSRHRMTRVIQARTANMAGIEVEERLLRCEQSRSQSARTMNCLLLLENVIAMDEVLAYRGPREAALIFWHKIFLNAPAILMELAEVDINLENEELMDKYREEIWKIVWSYNARLKCS